MRFFAVLLAIVLVNSFIIIGIPAHPDEYSAYHAFACWQDAQKINRYHSSCSNIEMNFGPLHYTQSYLYVGIASSLLMAFFSFFIDPISAHFAMGIIALILSTLGMKLSFNLKSKWYLFLIMFPVAFSIIRDGSPARITVIVFAFFPYLFRLMLTSTVLRRVGFWILLNFMILLAIEDKPFIIYLAPGMLMIVLAHESKEKLRFRFGQVVSSSLWFASLFSASLVFLVGTKQNGEIYLFALAKSNESRLGAFLLFSLASAVLHIFSWYAFAVRFVDINYDPIREQPEFYEALPWGSGVLSIWSLILLLLTTLFASYLFYSWIRKSILQIKTSKMLDQNTIYLIATLLLFFVPVLGGAWTSHHFVFAQMMVVVLLVKHSSSLPLIRWEVAVSAISLLTALSLTMFPHRSYNSEDSRKVIDQAIYEAKSSDVINCAYSCYFEYSLRNIKKIPITFAISSSDVRDLVERFSTKGQVFHICKECATNGLFDDRSVQAKLITQEGEWFLFKLTNRSAN